MKELYVLLNENYVEDDDNMFRFDYSPEFLRWALQPPGSLRDWHVGVRYTELQWLSNSVAIYEPGLQGDPSSCSLGAVDIKTKVAF